MDDGTPHALFEAMYQRAGGDPGNLPWARLAPDPLVTTWLERAPQAPGNALVVACGLGDDAEALAAAGWNVTAFDIAPRAIEWCKERFPDSTVDYVVADLFDLPAAWMGAFGLVVEVLTIQSLAPDVRPTVMGHIARTVAPRGVLLVATIGRRTREHRSGPPWPVSRDELGDFGTLGLEEVRFDVRESRWGGFDLFDVEYQRR